MIYLTAIGLSPGGSSTVHTYTQTVHRTTQNKQYLEQHNNLGEYGPCPVLASYTLAFVLQLRKKPVKTAVRVVRIPNTEGAVGVIVNCTLFVYRYYSGMQQIIVSSSDDFKLQTDNNNDFVGIIFFSFL